MRGVRWIVGALALAGATACGVATDESADEQGDALGRSSYGVRLPGSWDFCLAPVMADSRTSPIIAEFSRLPLPNLGNVRTLGHFADVAYWEPEKIGPELEKLGFGRVGEGADLAARDATKVHRDQSIEFFSTGYSASGDGKQVTGHTQVVWAQHRSEPWVVIAFRGTEFQDVRDLWTDADFPTVPFASGPKWGRVHGGFDRAYRTVKPLLDERLAGLRPGTKIWVTGHSLGGALASLFAADLLERMDRGERIRFDGLVTFGSPRVGDTRFFTHAEEIAVDRKVALHRVQNVSSTSLGYDPIVHVPFRSTFGEDFGHVGAPLKIYEDGTVEYGVDPGRFVGIDENLIPDAIASFKRKLLDGLTASFPHFLARYGERVDKAIQSRNYADLQRCGSR